METMNALTINEKPVEITELNTNSTSDKTNISESDKVKKRSHKRKRIRRLVNSTDAKPNGRSISKCKRIAATIAVLSFTIAVLIGHYFTNNNSNAQQIVKDFLKNYRNQYTQIVHGHVNYCDQNQQLDSTTLFAKIRKHQILHQEKALQDLEIALRRNESTLNAISLVGPVGVGKSLVMRAIQENFPWPENVHTYAWNTFVEDEAKKFQLIRLLVENLSDCGHNLLVIENLQACDYAVVELVNEMIRIATSEQKLKVIVAYVFSLNTMLKPEAYEKQTKLLQLLPDTESKVINFKALSKDEIKDCIQREMNIENIVLTSKQFDEVIGTIVNPLRAGCKNINSKVLMYGTLKKN